MNLQILSNAAIPLQEAINQLLRPLIGSFKATTAPILDSGGNTTDVYSTIVHNGGSKAPGAVPVDNVAAVMDCYHTLTIETLQAAYQRIRAAKSIRKTDRAGPV